MERTTQELDNILTKKYLIEEYTNKKLPIIEIARRIGCDQSTIKSRLLKHNISIRSIKESYTEEVRQKMRLAKLGKHYHTKESKEKISKAQKGKVISKEQREKTSKALKGVPLTEERKFKIGESNKGKFRPKKEKHWNWKGGVSSLIKLIYTLPESKAWKNGVFKRDHFTCRKCNKVGGKLEAHHIKKLTLILQEFLQQYSQLDIEKDKYSLVELAKSYLPFWRLDNGKTLCIECHKLEEVL